MNELLLTITSEYTVVMYARKIPPRLLSFSGVYPIRGSCYKGADTDLQQRNDVEEASRKAVYNVSETARWFPAVMDDSNPAELQPPW